MLNGWQHEELGMLDIKVINQRGLDKEIITADDYQKKKKKKTADEIQISFVKKTLKNKSR